MTVLKRLKQRQKAWWVKTQMLNKAEANLRRELFKNISYQEFVQQLIYIKKELQKVAHSTMMGFSFIDKR